MSDRLLPFEPDDSGEPENGNGKHKKHKLPDSGDIRPIVHGNCKLCHAQDRERAELMYEQSRNCARVQRFLESKGLKVGYHAVSRHMVKHYEQCKNEMILKWYTDDLTKWVRRTNDPEEATKLRMAVLERELHILASMSDALALPDRRRNAEQIRKLAETLSNCESQMAEFRREREPIKFIFQQLKIVMNDKLKQVDSQETRGVMVEVLNGLQEKVGDLIVQNEN